MLARLGFSVIGHLDSTILLIDEVLAVGYAKFQQKCLAKMKELKEQGVTMILVSPCTGDLENICTRAIWIDNHRIKMDGPVSEVIPEYKKFFGIEN